MKSVRDLSDSTKAIVYLGGVLFAVGAGSVAAYKAFGDIISLVGKVDALEMTVKTLSEENTSLQAQMSELQKSNFVKYGDPVVIYDPRESSIVVTRHSSEHDGGAGYFVSSYEWGRTNLGRKNTQIWSLRIPN